MPDPEPAQSHLWPAPRPPLGFIAFRREVVVGLLGRVGDGNCCFRLVVQELAVVERFEPVAFA